MIYTKLSGTYKGATFIIDYKFNPYILRLNYDPTIVYPNLPIKINKINYYSTPADAKIQEFGFASRIGIKAFTLFSIFTAFSAFLIFVKFLQLLDFLMFLNVDVPTNV